MFYKPVPDDIKAERDDEKASSMKSNMLNHATWHYAFQTPQTTFQSALINGFSHTYLRQNLPL